MAESVDALDLKSNWAYNPVPVQVWPGADKKDLARGLFLLYKNNLRLKRSKGDYSLSGQFVCVFVGYDAELLVV